MKMNSLVDPELIDALYAACQAGVGSTSSSGASAACSPACRACRENIRVRSIVGRYLEHSRIYRFANGDGQGRAAYYIGSADLMPRNLDRRVEALVPVTAPAASAAAGRRAGLLAGRRHPGLGARPGRPLAHRGLGQRWRLAGLPLRDGPPTQPADLPSRDRPSAEVTS